MKKIFFLLAACLLLLTSCSDSKTFTKADNSEITAVPYGFATKEDKIPGVVYELNTGDIILSVIFSETLIVPAIILCTDIYEPVAYNESTK